MNSFLHKRLWQLLPLAVATAIVLPTLNSFANPETHNHNHNNHNQVRESESIEEITPVSEGNQEASADSQEVTLKLVHHYRKNADGKYPEGKPTDTPRLFTNNLGYQITLNAAYLTVADAQLQVCDQASKWWRLMAVIPVAHAQSTDSISNNRMFVENMLRADFETIEVTSLKASDAAYCRLALTLAPATAESQALPAKMDMVGKTLYLKGKYLSASGGEARAFEFSVTEQTNINVSFQDHDSQDSELKFSAEDASKEIVVGIAYDGWLDDVDFEKMDHSQQTQKIIGNVVKSVHHHKGHTNDSSQHQNHGNSHHN